MERLKRFWHILSKPDFVDYFTGTTLVLAAVSGIVLVCWLTWIVIELFIALQGEFV